MAGIHSPVPREPEPQDPRLERAGWLLAGSFGTLGLVMLAGLVARPADPFDLLVAALIALAASAAWLYWRAAANLELRRRGEAEGFARILQGLSRSVSPDAIVEAIAEELGVASGADHVVVVRLRPNTGLLEATLVTSRAGVPSSTTVLPLSDLEDPLGAGGQEGPAPVAVGRAPVAVGPGTSEAVGSRVLVSRGNVAAGVATSAPPATGVPRRVSAIAEQSWPRVDGPTFRARIAAERGRPVADRIAERLAARVRSVYGLKNAIVAPLSTGSGVVGAIVLSRRTSDPWSDTSTRLLRAASVEASAALARAYSHRAAEARAATDALTGLPNRRYFDEYLGLFARRRRSDDAVGILMIDIDHFKLLNDRFGHAVGDVVLKSVADAIVSAVRDVDVPARFGGEEFVVLLRNPGDGVAVGVGERVREAVRALDLMGVGVPEVSVSVGVAVGSKPDEPIAELIEQADRAMYRAKRAGRDRVVAA